MRRLADLPDRLLDSTLSKRACAMIVNSIETFGSNANRNGPSPARTVRPSAQSVTLPGCDLTDDAGRSGPCRFDAEIMRPAAGPPHRSMTVETPAALLSALHRLSASIDQEPVFLTLPLAALGRELEAAVSSYLGVQLTVFTELGLPITLTHVDADTNLSTITTSLRVSLAALTSGEASGHITFYGGRRGSLVDLAADLSFVLGSAGPDGVSSPAPISLDEHLHPSSMQASLVGAEEVSVVNRAIGVLIGWGRTPAEAEAELVLGAQEAAVSLPAFAHQTLLLAHPAP